MSEPNRPLDPATLNERLIEQLKREWTLRDERVEEALRAVQRHRFVPGTPLERAYSDEVIGTKLQNGVLVSSASQPAIVAIMLTQLDVQPGDRVLEIGAGTGFNAALLAHLAGPDGQVTTVDLDEDLVQAARAHLNAAGFARVRVVQGDGALGEPAGAPYDRIMLTVGAPDILPAWREQLRDGGRLVLPLTLRAEQVSIAFDRRSDVLVSTSIEPCGFMPLRGAFAMSSPRFILPGDMPVRVMTAEPGVDTGRVPELLSGPGRDIATGVSYNPDRSGRLGLWIALHDAGSIRIFTEGPDPERTGIPPLFSYPGRFAATYGLLGSGGMALLAPGDAGGGAPELLVRSFGPAAPSARLVELTHSWDAAGCPGLRGLLVTAWPAGTSLDAADGALIDTRFSRFVVRWEA